MTDDHLRTLSTRFIEAKLAGTKENGNNGGYLFRSNEGAAEVAVEVVKQWLVDQAKQTNYGSGEFVLKKLADSLDGTNSFSVDPVIETIRSRRAGLGLSQAELARLAKTTQSAISELETGVAAPTLTTLRKVCTALGLDVLLEVAS